MIQYGMRKRHAFYPMFMNAHFVQMYHYFSPNFDVDEKNAA